MDNLQADLNLIMEWYAIQRDLIIGDILHPELHHVRRRIASLNRRGKRTYGRAWDRGLRVLLRELHEPEK